MTGATFGRKGIDAAEPVRRRTEFLVAHEPAEDEMARRRAAFIASERARVEQAVDDGEARPATAAPAPAQGRLPGEKSLATAYLLWFFLGGLSVHRFYLGRPLSAVLQVALWYCSLVYFMLGNASGFYLVIGGWLWIIGDGLLIPGLLKQANEKLRARRATV